MYMGHLGIALGTRRLSSRLPLWLLLVASTTPDLVNAAGGFTPWSGWVIHHSHTLAGIGILAIAMGVIGGFLSRSLIGALLAAGLVLSHMVADWIVTSVALWPNGPAIGFRLYYHHPILDFIIELFAILVGLFLYRQSYQLRWCQKVWPSVAILVVLVGFQAIWDGMLIMP
ncbi:MAG: hypothetical protein ACREPY_02270 [Rhodanobacteraceae bacterium]